MAEYEAYCPYCRGRVEPMEDDPPHEWYICPTHGDIPIADVEMELPEKEGD